jgi:hypothetical protein
MRSWSCEIRRLGRGHVGSIRMWLGHVARGQRGRAGSDPHERGARLVGRADRDRFKERSWDGPIFTAVGFATKIICCKQQVSSFIPDKGVVVTK